VPRPRFEKLDPGRRVAILAVAAEEFAEHGFEAASYNRIIERSGLSKGAIYYYFDDKEDLYATVLKDAVQRLILDTGDLAGAGDAASFWRDLADWNRRSLRAFRKDPHAIGLARSLLKALARGSAGGALVELRSFARSWFEGFVAHGQGVGAVRTDLPSELLVSVLLSMEEGIDLWLGDRIAEMAEAEIDTTVDRMSDLYKRLAMPPEALAAELRSAREGATPNRERRKT
jgi:AcrR family transcriptional regulator